MVSSTLAEPRGAGIGSSEASSTASGLVGLPSTGQPLAIAPPPRVPHGRCARTCGAKPGAPAAAPARRASAPPRGELRGDGARTKPGPPPDGRVSLSGGRARAVQGTAAAWVAFAQQPVRLALAARGLERGPSVGREHPGGDGVRLVAGLHSLLEHTEAPLPAFAASFLEAGVDRRSARRSCAAPTCSWRGSRRT